MLNELYSINESGQMEMNFDALELVTSKEFVEEIKFCMGDDMQVVSVRSVHSSTTVVLKGEYIAYVCYYRAGIINSVLLSMSEMKVLSEVYKELSL